MELLDERPVWSMSGGELLSTLDTMKAEIARLETRCLHFIARVDEIGYAEQLGARDTIELLSFRYRLNPRDARRDVQVARALPRYRSVSHALAEPNRNNDGPDLGAGEDPTSSTGWTLHPAQADAIVSTLERHAKRIPVEDRDMIEEQLVGLAAHLTPDELRTSAKELCNLVDTDGPVPEENSAYDRESLKLSTADNGVKFNGYLANENAELLRTWLNAAAKPRKTVTGEFDPRPRDKRNADALTSALSIAAAATDTGLSTRPSTTPTADTASTGDASADSRVTGHTGRSTAESTGLGETSATTRPPAVGSGETSAPSNISTGSQDVSAGETPPASGGAAGWVPGFGAKANITITIDFNDLKAATANATGQLVYGDNLSAAAIRRLACDANILPLVLGSNSEPLDVGRSERLVNRAMRRALNARDKGCVVCGAPPIYCDAHHLTHWIDGGETRIDNLVLLCRRHHVDLHQGHWTIQITNGTVHVARPTWADPTPTRTPHSRKRTPAPQHTPAHQRPNVLAESAAEGPATEGAATHETDRPDPWGDPVSPSQPAQPSRSKWTADEAMLADAARFAVWGDSSTKHSSTSSRPPNHPTPSSPTNPPDPWDDAVAPHPSTTDHLSPTTP
ncbi:HNH endonuclease signature motif containing protein [Kribbella antiqua]|nr:HNH endonuclease signature motif containing protein [Kribbella antiqua]